MIARHLDQPPNLLLDGFFLLDVVQMARVIANLVDMGRDPVRDSIVFLQIDRKRDASGLGPDFLERRNLLVTVQRNADDARAGIGELLALQKKIIESV